MSSAVSEPAKVSFTVRRPTPISRQGSSGLESDQESAFKVPALPRHLTENGRSTSASPLANGSSIRSNSVEPDSSDEEEEDVDEIVVGFDQFGVQRAKEKKKNEGPLVIPALANKDWREVARRRKAEGMFVPASGAAKTGADGSVGGLGTKDTINSGPALVGLIVREKKTGMDVDGDSNAIVESTTTVESTEVLTEDELARRALIAQARGEPGMDSEFTIPAIPSHADDGRPLDETDAYRKDVVTRPESASLEDYERVPVEQFGAALLRGMGWKPGQAASRTRTGLVEPYLPTSRPALLGIGAKERDIPDDGSKTKKPTRPERKYVPVVKRERGGDSEKSSSHPNSRRSSRSPDTDRRRDKDRHSERDGRREKDGERDHERRRSYADDRERRRDRDGDDRDHRERRKEKDHDDRRDRDRKDRYKDDDRRRDRDRDRNRARDQDYDRRR